MAYTSLEEQEINEIKSWWNENYKSLIAILIIALAGVFGWRYWQDHQTAKAHEMSALYDKVVAHQDVAAKQAQIDAFVQDNEKTGYAALVLLEKAKDAVNKQDFASAAEALKQAASHAPEPILAATANMRLAEVQFQQKDFDGALATLAQVKESGFANPKALLTGEIQLAKGDKAAAKASFEEALKNATALEQQEAQVRLNNL
ncbi:tetratricopeptide repeat protein [Bisgaard Taxon 10/6]|uniref:Ancillary SecYEG translocon subunit n=1 Tax=Exercitatus varius TaxID=67857 RepID=A0AAW6Q7V9_9PAST|nr:tetratricopeptide repeat protein [Exercitatus varius]MDG2939554.1 tetratricopeptide repeat protein [Exercitatus varius]MDG2940880.1 tetratricopeptide repeat protein [Exercitatus varius]MDG2944856.1 tetratricopeptide repeat protein [Exercitatus varius]MDG2949412.1 tetratricopeptide repeat protein [Exercitatus varius]